MFYKTRGNGSPTFKHTWQARCTSCDLACQNHGGSEHEAAVGARIGGWANDGGIFKCPACVKAATEPKGDAAMKFVWKCDRGHVVVKHQAERREHRGESRYFQRCPVCRRMKPLSRQMQKEPS